MKQELFIFWFPIARYHWSYLWPPGDTSSYRTMASTCCRAPVSHDEFAPAWLRLGLAGRWDEKSFPSEETFTFLYSHVIKLQLLEGKAHREVQQKPRSYLKRGSQCLHGGTEQKGYQTWAGSLGKIPLCSEGKRNVSIWHNRHESRGTSSWTPTPGQALGFRTGVEDPASRRNYLCLTEVWILTPRLFNYRTPTPFQMVIVAHRRN